MKKGIFITFEGADGTGKTSVINNIAKKLEQINVFPIITREPGDITLPFNKDVRELNWKYNDLENITEAYLFQADRAEHVAKLIIPMLKQGKTVISDRYIDSSIVYQGVNSNVSRETIKIMNEWSTQGIKPDITFILDAKVDTIFNRMQKLNIENNNNLREVNKFDLKNKEYYKTIIEDFKKIATTEKRFVLIDANKSIEEVSNDVFVYLKKLYEN